MARLMASMKEEESEGVEEEEVPGSWVVLPNAAEDEE